MHLLVGLGNPGKEYESHRHNVGFMAVDLIADKYGFPPFKKKYQGDYAEGVINGNKVAILKPMTFMNNSGKSVGEAAKFYKIPPQNIIAFHDELDIAPFRVKVKTGGGAGGHNGLRSMDDWLGTPDYKRVRLGIGHPGDKNRVTGYVLGNFAKSEEEELEKFLKVVVDAVTLLLQDKDEEFMTKVALILQPPKLKKEKKEEKDGI
ncbi:MAG: aminoacyl-tRNA hydrolase [Micavibrio aeruginosavorus]|uniref:Peptidyl-tRNA hydrolase n=1 Tax=Micavibrio aeruginosavorus TaxID=349221 RepID=A0A2W5FN94_9BACT|nr:MAG: aminoacyl-tRNA hydrolase [Micavibrio aeruginosavorus]